MPGTVLTPQARRALTQFPREIDDYALARYFTLTDQERAEIRRYRGGHNRLGFACQLCWLRWLGWQPKGRAGAPVEAIALLAQQLNLPVSRLANYAPHPRMWREHADLARKALGWRIYRQAEEKGLEAWLFDEALHHNNLRGLLDSAISYLRREHIVRPGLTVLERLVARVRTRAEAHLGQLVDALLTVEQKKELDALIAASGPGDTSRLQFLKSPPGKPTSRSLLSLLDKIERVRDLGIEGLDLSTINPNRRKVLAREAARLFPIDLRRVEAPRRYAMLVCLLDELLCTFNDQAIEMHSQLLRETANRSEGRQNKELIQRRQLIHTHMTLLKDVGQVVLNDRVTDSEVRPAIFKVISRAKLAQVVKECEALAKPEAVTHLTFLSGSYSAVRAAFPRNAPTPRDGRRRSVV